MPLGDWADGPRMAVRESEFASQVVDSLTSGVVGIDTSGCVVLFNEGARRLLAPPLETCEAALGRPIAEVLTAQPRLAPLLLAALTPGGH
jgi:nitrogen fixation/metabolism regulation signal transduction histidine kinase